MYLVRQIEESRKLLLEVKLQCSSEGKKATFDSCYREVFEIEIPICGSLLFLFPGFRKRKRF